MLFGLTETQQTLKNTVRKFLAAECPLAEVRRMMETETAFDSALWTKMAEQGWTGIIFPEEHGGFGMDLDVPAVLADARAADAGAVEDQLVRPRAVEDADLLALAGLRQIVDETGSAARHLGGEAAPELELPIDLESLASIGRVELDALAAHPNDGVEAVVDQRLDHVGMGAVLRHPRHVVEIFLAWVAAEIGIGKLGWREVGDDAAVIVDAVEGKAYGAGGVAAVAAAVVERRALEDEDAGAVFARRERGAERGVAGADDENVAIQRLGDQVGWLPCRGVMAARQLGSYIARPGNPLSIAGGQPAPLAGRACRMQAECR